MALRILLGGAFLTRHFGVVFGGLWFVVGLSFVIGGLSLWQTDRRFLYDALSAEGQVLTRDIRSASSQERSSTEYRVTYRFRTPSGASYEGASKVDLELWERLEEQGPVTVRYLPDDPAASRLADAPQTWDSLIMAGLGSLFAIAGGVILFVAMARRWTAARLRREGLVAEGTVLAIAPTNFRVNGVAQWRIHYRYQDRTGRMHDARSGLISPAEAERMSKGERGEVRYDASRPAKSLWMGRGAVR